MCSIAIGIAGAHWLEAHNDGGHIVSTDATWKERGAERGPRGFQGLPEDFDETFEETFDETAGRIAEDPVGLPSKGTPVSFGSSAMQWSSISSAISARSRAGSLSRRSSTKSHASCRAWGGASGMQAAVVGHRLSFPLCLSPSLLSPSLYGGASAPDCSCSPTRRRRRE